MGIFPKHQAPETPVLPVANPFARLFLDPQGKPQQVNDGFNTAQRVNLDASQSPLNMAKDNRRTIPRNGMGLWVTWPVLQSGLQQPCLESKTIRKVVRSATPNNSVMRPPQGYQPLVKR